MCKSHRTRSSFVQKVREELTGPTNGPNEELLANDPPHKRYSTGILYPQDPENETSTNSEGEGSGSPIGDADVVDDSPLRGVLARHPSSAGFTFAVTPDAEIELTVNTAKYEKTSANGATRYLRVPQKTEVITFRDPGKRSVTIKDLFDGDASLLIQWRIVDQLRVVTSTLINTKEAKRPNAENCLYQVSLAAQCKKGKFCEPPYPKPAEDKEEAELRLKYRGRIPWATGHGTSVSWDNATPPKKIEIDFIPVANVYQFTNQKPKDAGYSESSLSPNYLADINSHEELDRVLSGFLKDFSTWLKRQKKVKVDHQHQAALRAVIENLTNQESRLKAGVKFICDPAFPNRFVAFKLANRGMLLQMERAAHVKKRRFEPNSVRWHPFQLAFQLLSMPGAVLDDKKHQREIVDLIWFPTGGGKTEAYLLLAAFVIIYRRLEDAATGAGTAVISRYTLRLLTSQQFTRTATLVCALEHMRREKKIPGNDPISIGLWIGGGKNSTPNTLRQAYETYLEMREQERPRNTFMLQNCPWCGTSILPSNRSPEDDDYGIHCTATDFSLRCRKRSCPFSDKLPVDVVDEVIYQNAPSILLGTIDKFARLPWMGHSRSLFGLGNSKRSPDLIIQDELHLISGPLGTIAAVYEAGIDVLLQMSGNKPKIVAATATIRGATEQARRLYGKEVCVFPAPGPNCDDSYFMREDLSENDKASRQYIGYMGQGQDPVTNTVRIMSAMLQAAEQITEDDDYWTLVAYHNSRRELGKTQTLARDDIPARIKLIASDSAPRKCERVEELSGQIASHRIPNILQDMERRRESGDAIDVVTCTNMISVGIDIDRLNAMVIMGQPKTSAEYIQASSRVGRGIGSAGVVAVNFSPTKPRDRSHYESFYRFHDAIYRWVEPTSVTPQAPPALDRALHAAVIMALRLSTYPGNDQADEIGQNPKQEKMVIKLLKQRLIEACGTEQKELIVRSVDNVIDWWKRRRAMRPPAAQLRYQGGRAFEVLMKHYGSGQGNDTKATLNSMRNVDAEIHAQVLEVPLRYDGAT